MVADKTRIKIQINDHYQPHSRSTIEKRIVGVERRKSKEFKHKESRIFDFRFINSERGKRNPRKWRSAESQVLKVEKSSSKFQTGKEKCRKLQEEREVRAWKHGITKAQKLKK